MDTNMTFIQKIEVCKKVIEKHNQGNDPILDTMLQHLDRMKVSVENQTLNKNATTLAIVRYLGEYDFPEDIVASVEAINNYYHNIYKHQ